MGLFSTEIRDDLIKIKNIRNQFAHSAIPLTFNNPIVAHTCNLLQSVPQSLNDPVVILRQGFGREHLDIVGLGQPSPNNPEAEARIRFIFACNALMGRFYNSVVSAIEEREKIELNK
jgi:hypothetical protein